MGEGGETGAGVIGYRWELVEGIIGGLRFEMSGKTLSRVEGSSKKQEYQTHVLSVPSWR